MLKDDEFVGAIAIYPAGGPPVHQQADRAGHELCRAGGDRHREHAPAQRIAPAHRRSLGICCSSRPPHRRHPARDLELAGRASSRCLRHGWRARCPHLRGARCRHSVICIDRRQRSMLSAASGVPARLAPIFTGRRWPARPRQPWIRGSIACRRGSCRWSDLAERGGRS